MARDIILQRILFIVLVCFIILIQMIFFANMLLWRSSPDKGWIAMNQLGPRIVAMIRPQGEEAGLRVGDKILTINGKSYETFDELDALIDYEIGHMNEYRLERKGEILTVKVPTGKLGLRNVIFQSGIYWMLGIIFIGIGILVFLMKPYYGPCWAFLIMTMTLGIVITYFTPSYFYKPIWLESVLILFLPLLPASILHLTALFPEKRTLFSEKKWLLIIPYLFSLMLAIAQRSFATRVFNVPCWLLNIIHFYLFASLMVFLGSTFYRYLKTKSAAVRLQSLVILTGIIIALLIPMIELLSNLVFKVSLFPNPIFFYLFFLIFFPLSISYGIVRHDLFEIDLIIRRTYGYILATGSIIGGYALFVFFSNLAFGQFRIAQSSIFPLVFVLAAIFLFNPIRNRLQKFIDRVFYRLEYDYQKSTQRISEIMCSLLNLDRVTKAILDFALDTMFIDAGCIMLLNPRKQSYECLIHSGEKKKRSGRTGKESRYKTIEVREKDESGEIQFKHIKGDISGGKGINEKDLPSPGLNLSTDNPLIQKLAKRKKEVTIYDIQADPFFDDQRDLCKEAFDRMEATLVVPLIYEDRLTGLISLGDKKSGKFYRREDINLLRILANQGAVAIENARLMEEVIEKERMEEELAIARDLQLSMLPISCPKIKGFQIAAFSLPAREVGGDFFDFIEIDDEKLGLVIGDVTGKSVSGALVMAASRSVFRILSEDTLNTGDIMNRANQRLKKDTTKNIFVALLYAILNLKDQTLNLCSAGQNQPIYISSRNREGRFVETKGDRFPLGILDDAWYQETYIQLKPGDKVIFYTDGIVEAMNRQKEIFGFERLMEAAKDLQLMTAESILQGIIEKVKAFSGNIAQNDDLTIIVLSVDNMKSQQF